MTPLNPSNRSSGRYRRHRLSRVQHRLRVLLSRARCLCFSSDLARHRLIPNIPTKKPTTLSTFSLRTGRSNLVHFLLLLGVHLLPCPFRSIAVSSARNYIALLPFLLDWSCVMRHLCCCPTRRLLLPLPRAHPRRCPRLPVALQYDIRPRHHCFSSISLPPHFPPHLLHHIHTRWRLLPASLANR